MNFKDVAQTAILICCLIMIPVLALAYIFYSHAGLSSLEVLDKSFGVMVGVFGGAATLAAAYIASRLFNDWRDAQSTSNRSEHAVKTLRSLIEIQNLLDRYKYKINMYCNYYPYEQDLVDFNKKYLEIKNDANNRYAELKAEYKLNAMYFLSVYNIDLPVPSNEYSYFDDYLYSINGAFSELHDIDLLYRKDIQNNVPIHVYLAGMDEKQSEFKNEIVDDVYSKLAPHITLGRVF